MTRGVSRLHDTIENNYLVMKAFVKYGLWTGIISGLWGLVSFTVVGWLNNSAFHGSIPATQIRSYSGLFSLIILALGIYLGLKQTRTRNGNSLTYSQAVKTGIGIAVITAVLVAIFTWLYCTIINPGYADFMAQDVQHSMTSAGKSTAEIAQAAEATRKEFSTGAQVAQALIGQVVVGTLLTLIFGLFLRTKNK
jgi:hypothetical protein